MHAIYQGAKREVAMRNGMLILAMAGLAACARVTWDRPGTTQDEFAMDRAQCQLLAEAANPDPGVETIDTGKLGRDIAENAAAGIVHGIVQGAALGHTFALCMQARGYQAISTAAQISGGSAPMPIAQPVSGDSGGNDFVQP